MTASGRGLSEGDGQENAAKLWGRENKKRERARRSAWSITIRSEEKGGRAGALPAFGCSER